MIKKYLKIHLMALVCVISAVTTARADTGVPMVFITLPAMVIGLIPIIIIEAFLIHRLMKASTSLSVKTSVIANLISTFAGIPLTWVSLFALQIFTGGGKAFGTQSFFQKFLAVTWQSPWLIPYESNLYWMVPTASIVLMVPFFFVSWFIEYAVGKKIHPKTDKSVMKLVMFKVNAVTYIILIILSFVWLLASIANHDKKIRDPKKTVVIRKIEMSGPPPMN